MSERGLLLISEQATEILRLRAELKDAMEMLFNQAKTIKELQDKLGIESNVGD